LTTSAFVAKNVSVPLGTIELKLIQSYLKAGVIEGMKGWEATGQGTPQGGVVSRLLANTYLDELDWRLVNAGMEMVRYADDFVVLSRSEAEAQTALELISQWMQAAQLQLHPEKTKIVDATQPGGFEFLGYQFERGYKWPRAKRGAALVVMADSAKA
jgi:RNA-directed DNA polymerase